MRAAVIERHGTAPAIGERPPPAGAEAHALVSTTAAPVTPLDVLCATGTSYFGPPPLPYVPGVQGVGVVQDARGVPAGTRVWFPTTAGMAPGDGSMAQQVLLPETELVALPDGVEDTLVAALGLSAIAAWAALIWKAGLRPGEKVLVLGGGSVVGQVAIQAARLSGAGRVVAASRSSRAQERARTCGADAVVALRDDDEPDELAGRLTNACAGNADVVIDPLCGVPATAALQLLAPGGRFVNLGSSAGDSATFTSATLRSRSARLLGYTNNEISTARKGEALRALLQHAAAGRLRVDHEVVPLDRLPGAWERQANGLAERRIVVDLTAQDGNGGPGGP
ncbi:zinc-binding dehydrogenase [Streptomyces sp. WMMB 322]|uniref:quinone oxidoreductase family protein n=1 Tax=Streptomyces sp. WMMB 322 TaxID=1286821 RepID=UPI0008237F26|nr:zinc-binding dehydrogenase [Streptomyces sp. WMMB 322]SCK13014.1 NADPH:quinone reductase [Streptomyces sp. WMMB 322]